MRRTRRETLCVSRLGGVFCRRQNTRVRPVWGSKKCGRAAFRKVGKDTEIEKAAVWGYASRLVFIAFITVSIVSSASARAITASQN